MTLIERGGRHETTLAFNALGLLDGGDLEVVMRALAGLAADHPRLLLEQLEANEWEPARIESLVRMLPLETVDRPDEKLRVVKQRLVGLRRIHDARLETVRTPAIVSLQSTRPN